VCGRTKNGKCSITDDGLHLCKEYNDPDSPVSDDWRWCGVSKDGLWGLWRPRDDDSYRRDDHFREMNRRFGAKPDPLEAHQKRVEREVREAKNRAKDEQKRRHAIRLDEYIRKAARRRPAMNKVLAESLGVPRLVEGFDLVPVGHLISDYTTRNWPCWVYPQYDGDGIQVAWQLRYEKPLDKALGGADKITYPIPGKSSGTGLIIQTGWKERAEATERRVYCVEGMTDVAAVSVCGLSAIGRPSNRGGVGQMARLFRDLDHKWTVIVVGENDYKGKKKPDGTPDWPGKDGAIESAKDLADMLPATGPRVEAAMIMGCCKDSVEWLKRILGYGVTRTEDLGQLYRNDLTLAWSGGPGNRWIRTPDVPLPEARPEDEPAEGGGEPAEGGGEPAEGGGEPVAAVASVFDQVPRRDKDGFLEENDTPEWREKEEARRRNEAYDRFFEKGKAREEERRRRDDEERHQRVEAAAGPAAASISGDPHEPPEVFFSRSLLEQFRLTKQDPDYRCKNWTSNLMRPLLVDNHLKMVNTRCCRCDICHKYRDRKNFLNYRFHMVQDLNEDGTAKERTDGPPGGGDDDTTRGGGSDMGDDGSVLGKRLFTFRVSEWDYDREGRLFGGRYCHVKQQGDGTRVVFAIGDPSAVRVEPELNPRGVEVLTLAQGIERLEAAVNHTAPGKRSCGEGFQWRRPEECQRDQEPAYAKVGGLRRDWEDWIPQFRRATGLEVELICTKPEQRDRVLKTYHVKMEVTDETEAEWVRDCFNLRLTMTYATWLREMYVSPEEANACDEAFARRRGEAPAGAGVPPGP
jgi:hypothetical protein